MDNDEVCLSVSDERVGQTELELLEQSQQSTFDSEYQRGQLVFLKRVNLKPPWRPGLITECRKAHTGEYQVLFLGESTRIGAPRDCIKDFAPHCPKFATKASKSKLKGNYGKAMINAIRLIAKLRMPSVNVDKKAESDILQLTILKDFKTLTPVILTEEAYIEVCQGIKVRGISKKRIITPQKSKEYVRKRKVQFIAHYCDPCLLAFSTPQELVQHYNTTEHKETIVKLNPGDEFLVSQGTKGAGTTRTMPECDLDFNQSYFEITNFSISTPSVSGLQTQNESPTTPSNVLPETGLDTPLRGNLSAKKISIDPKPKSLRKHRRNPEVAVKSQNEDVGNKRSKSTDAETKASKSHYRTTPHPAAGNMRHFREKRHLGSVRLLEGGLDSLKADKPCTSDICDRISDDLQALSTESNFAGL